MAKIFGTPSPYLRERSIHYLSKSTIIAFGSLAIVYVFVQTLPLYPNKIVGLLVTSILILAIAIPAYKFYKEDDVTSENYYRGRKGESIILEELKKLPDEFLVFCDIKIAPPYNIDFLVAGPTGLFVVEVKSHSGSIGYVDEKITINGFVPKEKDFLKQAKGEAKSISEYLKKQIGTDHWVSPVLAFSNPNATMHFGLNPVDGTFVVQKGFLLKVFLENQREMMMEETLLKIEGKLQEFLTIEAKQNSPKQGIHI